MEIFNEILEQYMKIGFKNKQYKSNMQSLSLFVDKNKTNIESNSDESLILRSNNILKATNDKPEEYVDKAIDIKEFYSRLEFDARRYNRNFDSQTGAVLL